jgi:hypothetical protein
MIGQGPKGPEEKNKVVDQLNHLKSMLYSKSLIEQTIGSLNLYIAFRKNKSNSENLGATTLSNNAMDKEYGGFSDNEIDQLIIKLQELPVYKGELEEEK